MRSLRRYQFVWSFLALLAFCSVMVIRQINVNQSRHIKLREAFIILYTKGYNKESERLYQRLLRDLENLPNKALIDDFQRTLLLVDPSAQHPENLIWKYHWTVSNELEKRSEKTLLEALKLANERE